MSVYRELLESFFHIEQHASAHPEEDILLQRLMFRGRRMCLRNTFIAHFRACASVGRRDLPHPQPLPAKTDITVESKESFHCGCSLFVCLFVFNFSTLILAFNYGPCYPVHHTSLTSICIAFICYFSAVLRNTHISFKIY